jgi:hypothetical protein
MGIYTIEEEDADSSNISDSSLKKRLMMLD